MNDRSSYLLVVEHDPLFGALLADVLAEAGHAVESARDGFTALRIVGRDRFRLVIANAWLPGLDGCVLARRLREGDVPVLLFGVGIDRESPLPTGTIDLAVPFSTAELHASVSRALNDG